MSFEQVPPNPTPLEARLRILKIVCFLTFIGSGFMAIIYGFSGLTYDFLNRISADVMQDEEREAIKLLFSGGRWFLIINAFLFSISFTGAYMMWKLKKAGFHFYAVSQIMILILPQLFIDGFQVQWMNVILTALFIAVYASYVKIFR